MGVATDPNGARVYAVSDTDTESFTSGSSSYLTVGAEAATGALAWQGTYNASPDGRATNYSSGVVVTPDGEDVLVTGFDPTGKTTAGTIAYKP